MSDPMIRVRDLSKRYARGGETLTVLDRLNLEMEEGRFYALMGPSGSGKTTLLRILAGLIPPTSGAFTFGRGEEPSIGMVFQQATLMPWRTVTENIRLPLEVNKVDETTALKKTSEMIELVGLTGFEDSLPRDLSGGMAQRVAIARALIHDPDLLLLDEPFASLDAMTRERMWTELSNLWQARQKTVIMVTHSINESLFLADRVLVLTQRPGKIKMDMEVDLPRPRKDEIRYTSQFGKLAKKLRGAIE